MKKFLGKFIMVMMLAATLSLGFTSCSKDDDGPDGGGKKGKMTGWVKIDGKKYDYKSFKGEKDNDGEVNIIAFSKKFESITPNDVINMAELTMAFKADGTLDTEYGRPAFVSEFVIEYQPGTESGGTMYVSDDTSYEGITVTRDGNHFVIDGKNVEARYGNDYVNNQSPITHIDFHFEGTPDWMEFGYDD